MTRTVFNTACTIDGYIADEHDGLDWLFAVPGADDAESAFAGFLDGIGAIVMGSTTYRWLLEHEQLLEHPERWSATYGDRPTVVLSTGDLPVVPGAPISVRSGDVASLWPSLSQAAAGRDVWIVGGGDLAGQFADAGLLDEIRLSVAPASLGSGRPLLPRRLGPDRLRLRTATAAGQFAELVYDVQTAAVVETDAIGGDAAPAGMATA